MINKKVVARDNSVHYVNNETLLRLLREYKSSTFIPNDLHTLFYEMATRICSKPRFRGYTYTEDMISDAYIRCIDNAHKFDTEKDNPFSYFTTVIFNSFYQFLIRETKETHKKIRLQEQLFEEYQREHGIQLKSNPEILEKLFGGYGVEKKKDEEIF